MSFQRDYILRLIEQLREFMSQIVRLRLGERPDDALVAIIQAQERLFSRPAPLFLAQPPEEQFRMLTHGEESAEARAKCLIQVDLLSEAARVYTAKEQTALAFGAWQYALQLHALTAQHFPATEAADAAADVVRVENMRREMALLPR